MVASALKDSVQHIAGAKGRSKDDMVDVEEKRAPDAKAIELRHRDRVLHSAGQRFAKSLR